MIYLLMSIVCVILIVVVLFLCFSIAGSFKQDKRLDVFARNLNMTRGKRESDKELTFRIINRLSRR